MSIPFRRRTLATLVAAVCGAVPVAGHAAADAGKIDYAVGNVTATGNDGQRRDMGKGAPIKVGDTIETNAGRAWLRFSDGGYMSLQPGTEFRVDDYLFEGQEDGTEKSFFSLVKGGMRAVTGFIGRTNRQNYRVTTPVATIGIRGTEFLATLGNSLTLTCGLGVCVVTNEAGETVLQAGQTLYLKDQNAKGQRVTRKVVLPPNAPVVFAGGEFRNADGSLALIDAPEFEFSEDVPLRPGAEPGTFSPGSQSGLVLGLSYGGDGAEFGDANPQDDARVFTGTGPDYVTGRFDVDENGKLRLLEANWNPFVQFDNGISAFGGPFSADVDTDGVINWGRWAFGYVTGSIFDNGMLALFDGDAGDNEGEESVHFFTGVATPEEDLLNLASQNVVAVYNLLGATNPSFGDDGIEGGHNDFGDIVSVSGALGANFGAGTVRASVVLDFDKHDINIESGPLPIAAGAGGRFGGTGPWSTSTLNPGTNYTTILDGAFIGGAASRAGLAYDVRVTESGGYPVNGVTTFRQGGAATSITGFDVLNPFEDK